MTRLHRLPVLGLLLGFLAGCGCQSTKPKDTTDLAALKADPHVFAGLPRAKNPASEFTVLRNRGYAVGYSESRRNPLWAAYRLVRQDVQPTIGPRPTRFMADDRTSARVKHDDYTNSGFDRGHMAPNYAIATRFGQEAQVETFLMSNICPQKHTLNAGLWACLEETVADGWANQYDEVWVLVGPMFGPAPARLKAGVAVPDSFFMIVVAVIDGEIRAAAFVMAQDVSGSRPLSGFLTSVRKVEEAVGLDFFSDLEDALEERLETAVPAELWKIGEAWMKRFHANCRPNVK
jgi:endonuclease G